MRIALVALTTAAALVGCSRPDDGQATASTSLQFADDGQPTTWTSLQLQGKTLDLVDVTRVETYSFSDQGIVLATIGTKGGPVAGPAYYWKVKDNVLVISEMPDQQGIEELADPKIQGAIVSVGQKSGRRVQYRLASTNG